MFKRFVAVVLMVSANSAPTLAEDSPTPLSIAELHAQADFVAVVQMRDGDYVYERDFPRGGSAFLRVLVPYKGAENVDLVEIYEQGLHDHECYFPNPTLFEEGRRYLVFVRKDPDKPERFRGLATGCALEVLVTNDNLYALRYPLEGIALSDDLSVLAEPLSFQDAYATIERDTLNSDVRDDLVEQGLLVVSGEGYTWTHGVPLSEVRRLMRASGSETSP